MTTKRQFYSGATLEQAVLAAARVFELAPEEVAYTVRDKKHGFLKVRRRIVIEVDPDSPRRDRAPAREPDPPLRRDRQVRPVPAPGRDAGPLGEPELEPDDESDFFPDDELEEDETDAIPLDLGEHEAVERAARELLRFVRVEPEIEVRAGADDVCV